MPPDPDAPLAHEELQLLPEDVAPRLSEFIPSRPEASVTVKAGFRGPASGHVETVAAKTDYSPVREPAPGPEQKRERRLTKAFVFGAHAFWLYAIVLAGVIALLIWLLGGFDAGGR